MRACLQEQPLCLATPLDSFPAPLRWFGTESCENIGSSLETPCCFPTTPSPACISFRNKRGNAVDATHIHRDYSPDENSTDLPHTSKLTRCTMHTPEAYCMYISSSFMVSRSTYLVSSYVHRQRGVELFLTVRFLLRIFIPRVLHKDTSPSRITRSAA